MRPVWIWIMVACAYAGTISAQNALRIGEWRMHLPYNQGLAVTQNDARVFYGTETSLVSINKDDIEDVRFYSRIEGLNDIEIINLKYQASNDALILIYANSNIDLVYQDGILNVNDIEQNINIVGSKRVNHIWVDDSDIVFLSCDFGVLEFNMRTGKFGFTMPTGFPVYGLAIFEDVYYISTAEGLFKFDDFDTELISNFNAWKKLGANYGLPEDYTSQGIAVYNNQLFAAVDNALFALEETEFMYWDEEEGRKVNFLSPEGAHLKVGYICPDLSCAGIIGFYTSEGRVSSHGFQCVGQPTYAIEDEDGKVWYADMHDGIRFAGNYLWGCEFIEFNTPYSGFVSEIAVKDNAVYVASGGVNDIYNNLNRPDGFFTFDQGEWSFQNRTNNAQLAGYDPLDYFRILPHPDTDSSLVYIGTYGSGLLEYDQIDSTYIFYDQTNSALQGAVGSQTQERVAGLDMDREGNLWMSCYLAPRPLVVKKVDGTWKNFATPSGNQLGQVVVDQRGYKWVAIVSNSEGLLVFDDGGTIDDQGDDRYRVMRTTNSNLPTNALTNLVVDKTGDIWVGTSQGPVVFDGAGNPFEGNNQGYRVTVDQDGILAYLLAEEIVTTIAIDGANRKWIGTMNGVFVQSPNGEEQVATFNVENSPLLSNEIIDIAINPYDGEVFIGTASGIVSIRGDAIDGTTRHQSDAYAFPNPVEPDYTGPIAIRGLAENAAVKITDVAGAVVFETYALGGQAIWNGEDMSGRRAASGVYLVFSTTESQFDKPDAMVTKILLVN